MKLIDLVCPRGHIHRDAFVESLNSWAFPHCHHCGESTVRAWLTAPSITPQGTRAERNFERAPKEPKVDTTRIARDTAFEVEQKWLRYSDEKVAEQHVSREINEAAGIADAAGNEKPIPKPDPITFAKPTSAECAS